jgi:hypothetical protein
MEGMLDNLNSRTFSEHLHTMFRILLPEKDPLPVELIEVTELKYSPQVEQFSLIFRGPLAPQCQQQIQRMEHDKMGTFDLFLVPIGPDKEGMLYQASFNRFRKEGR